MMYASVPVPVTVSVSKITKSPGAGQLQMITQPEVPRCPGQTTTQIGEIIGSDGNHSDSADFVDSRQDFGRRSPGETQ